MPFTFLKIIQRAYFWWLNEIKILCFTHSFVFFSNLSKGIINSGQKLKPLEIKNKQEELFQNIVKSLYKDPKSWDLSVS